jgi:hypothetical protein
MRKLLFESKTCGRCGGSGEYSYCQSYGTRCFKCHGDGVVLTKRGHVAQRWFNEKRKKPAIEVKVGERIVIEGTPGFSRSEVVIVESAELEKESRGKYLCSETGEWKASPPHYVIRGKGAKSGEPRGMHVFEDTEIRMHVWGEALAALKAEAKAFEATLTKAGTVRKKGAAK